MTRRIAAMAAVAVAWPVLTTGQQGKVLPRFDTTLNVVAVPVFVTDGQGRAIPGLTKEDFEVQDDGQRVEVVGFQAFDSGDPAVADLLEEAPAARRQFMLLFDLSFSSVSGLVRAQKAALDLVEARLRPYDLAAVATISATHGVRLLQGFSSDRAQVKKAVQSLGVMRMDRRPDPLGLVFDLRELGGALADVREGKGNRDPFVEDVREMLIRYQQMETTSYDQRILALVDGLGRLGRALGGLQGRKQVILFSSGFEASSLSGTQGEDALQASEAVIHGRTWEVKSGSRFGENQLRTEMERALRSFSTSDAVVHAVDLSGLAASGEVSRAGKEPRLRSGEESLEQITNLGGGRLFKKTNDVGRALAEVMELSRYYYLLAFEPARVKGPGEFHKLKVRTIRKGTQISHRAGYFERKPYAETTPLEREFEAAEIIAKGIDRGEIGVRAMAVPYRTTEGALTLPVVLELDGATLLGPRAGGGKVGLEVFGYAFDAEGRAVDSVTLSATLDAATLGARLREHGAQLHATFSLAPGKYDLRFLVRDAETGRSGSSWLQVTVPAFAEGAGVALFPPLFMEDPQGWVVLHARSARTTTDLSPFVVDQDPFVPRARPQLRNGVAQRVCLLAFDGGARFDPGTSFEIKPALLDHEGDVVSVGKFQVLRSTAEAGFRRFVLGFLPRDVPPGDYSFRVRLRDPASGRVSEAFQAVSFD